MDAYGISLRLCCRRCCFCQVVNMFLFINSSCLFCCFSNSRRPLPSFLFIKNDDSLVIVVRCQKLFLFNRSLLQSSISRDLAFLGNVKITESFLQRSFDKNMSTHALCLLCSQREWFESFYGISSIDSIDFIIIIMLIFIQFLKLHKYFFTKE